MEIETDSKNYILRSLRPDIDVLDDYLGWLTDLKSNKYINGVGANNTLKDIQNYIKEKNNSSEAVLLGIFDKKSGLHIGNIKLEPIIENKETWVGLLIGNTKFRNKGVGSEVLDYVTKFAHSQFKIKKMYLGVHKNNLPAIALYLKSGFVMVTETQNNSENCLMSYKF